MIGLEFIAYLVFIVAGLMLGGICVYPVYQYLIRLEPGGEKKGFIGALVTLILALFAASR